MLSPAEFHPDVGVACFPPQVRREGTRYPGLMHGEMVDHISSAGVIPKRNRKLLIHREIRGAM